MSASTSVETMRADARSQMSSEMEALALNLGAGIESGIIRFFHERMATTQPVMILLVRPPFLFRPPVPGQDSERPKPWYERPVPNMAGWRPIGEISSVYKRILDRLLAIEEVVAAWSSTGLTYLAIVACEWAWQLSEQMGSPTQVINMSKKPVHFSNLFDECQCKVEQAGRLVPEAVEALVDGVPPKPLNGAPVKLCVEGKDGGIRVTWLAGDRRELGGESLQEFAQRVARPAAQKLAQEIAGLKAAEGRIRDQGQSILAEVSPKVAIAFERARKENRPIRIPICYGHANHLPAEVSLYIVPEGRAPSMILTARRAHEEFVLESDMGELFYFPPIQLAATITFSGRRWYTNALVRLPKHSPQWCHPYTGMLRDATNALAQPIDGTPMEAMVPVSEAGRRVMGSNVVYTQVDMCGDLCVESQDSEMRRLQSQVTAAHAKGQKPDLYELVRGLWNIVRIGLTRGHQLNHGTPRASLNTSNMPYFVRDRSLLTGPLASRVFPFNPHRPVQLG